MNRAQDAKYSHNATHFLTIFNCEIYHMQSPKKISLTLDPQNKDKLYLTLDSFYKDISEYRMEIQQHR